MSFFFKPAVSAFPLTAMQRLLLLMGAGRTTDHSLIAGIQSGEIVASPMAQQPIAVRLSPEMLEFRYFGPRISAVDPLPFLKQSVQKVALRR